MFPSNFRFRDLRFGTALITNNNASNNLQVMQARQPPAKTSEEFKFSEELEQGDESSDLSDSPVGGRSGRRSDGQSPGRPGAGGAAASSSAVPPGGVPPGGVPPGGAAASAAPPRSNRAAAAAPKSKAASKQNKTGTAGPKKRDGRAGKGKVPFEDWEDMLMIQCAMKLKYKDEVRLEIHFFHGLCLFWNTVYSE